MNPTEYDLLYRNLKEVETSSEEDEDDDEDFEENINHNKLKYRKKIFNFVIDSNDRDWVETNEETFDIKVKFGGDSDSFETFKKNIIDRTTKMYQVQTQTNKFFGSRNMFFPINVKNIESISVEKLIMPNRLLYLGGANYKHLLDLRYITISIEEISNCYYGTNLNINKSIGIMFPLSATYLNIGSPKQIEFIDKGRLTKEFRPTPLNCLDNLRIKINDSLGNQLKFKNDILEISEIDIRDNFFKITTKEYFNGEYLHGDLILIKNFSTTKSIDKRIVDFLNRKEGHIINIKNNFENNTYPQGEDELSITNLQNTFTILAPGDYNDGKFEKHDYVDNKTYGEITGKLINTNLQFTMFLKVESKVIEFDNLNTQII